MRDDANQRERNIVIENRLTDRHRNVHKLL